MKDLELEHQVKICVEAEKENFGKRPVSENLVVCLYELGRVARGDVYAGGVLDQQDIAAYAGEMCGELADVIAQSLIIFYKLRGHTKSFADITMHELIEMGTEKQQERMSEVKARTPGKDLGKRNVWF